MAINGSFSSSVRKDILERLDTFTSDYEKLQNAIAAESASVKPVKRFSCRASKSGMTIPKCVRFMLVMQSSDIHQELVDCNMFDPMNIPSESVYVQVRDKIPLASFENLFRGFVNDYYWKQEKLNWRFRILAVDGTEASYPANPDEPDNYVTSRSETKARSAHHINACIDTDRMMAIDIIIQNAHAKDERSALYQFMERTARKFPNLDQRRLNLFTTDRGYEAWNLPVLAEHLGFSYLCRIKEADSNGILSGIKDLLPDTRHSFDREISITLTRDFRKKKLSGYHYLAPNTTCELCTPEHDIQISIRIVKLRISETVTEYLMTNLYKSQYPKEITKDLYHRRWPAETCFSFAKYPLCLLSPHASSSVPVQKEIWCRFTMLNFVSTIVYHDADYIERKEETGRMYDYTRDFSSAIADCRAYLRTDAEYDLDTIIRRRIRPIRDKKPRPRNKSPRRVPTFGHRQG